MFYFYDFSYSPVFKVQNNLASKYILAQKSKFQEGNFKV